MLSVFPSVLVLGLMALLALRLALTRKSAPEAVAARRDASRALAVAVGIQIVHFAEEAATGFHEQFPALFGLPPIPFSLFVAFNVLWIALWLASIPGVRSGWTPAFFVSWFLAIAGIANGIAHPLLTVAVGGYFPGLASSPFIGCAGIWLWRRLERATRDLDAVR